MRKRKYNELISNYQEEVWESQVEDENIPESDPSTKPKELKNDQDSNSSLSENHEKTFKCNICLKNFPDNEEFMYHIAQVHEEKNTSESDFSTEPVKELKSDQNSNNSTNENSAFVELEQLV